MIYLIITQIVHWPTSQLCQTMYMQLFLWKRKENIIFQKLCVDLKHSHLVKFMQHDYNFFQRQKSFYDHIVRNDEDMQRIQEYIELNPYARKNDEYYK